MAVTEAADDAIMLHVPVPLHAPDQPANVEPLPAVAVRVIDVPAAKLALHVCPQLIPDGVLLTDPVPVPAFTTVNWTFGGVVTCEDPQPVERKESNAMQYKLGEIVFFNIESQVLSKGRSGKQ